MQNRSKSLDKFTRSLLATTCLTAAAGAANAAVITENVNPAPLDFPDSANGYLLPLGTTSVDGSLQNASEGGDTLDWFEFQGLTPGANFHLTVTINSAFGEGLPGTALFTDSAGFLDSNSGLGPFSFNGVVPLDGNLVVQMGMEGGFEFGYNYNADLTVDSVPEPSTVGLTGLGLAGAAAWSRRRKKE